MNSEAKRLIKENITYLKTDLGNKRGELSEAMKEVDKLVRKIEETKTKVMNLEESLEEKKDGKEHGASEETRTPRKVESKSDKDGVSEDRGDKEVRDSEQGNSRVQDSSGERSDKKKHNKGDKGYSTGTVGDRKPEEQHTKTSD